MYIVSIDVGTGGLHVAAYEESGQLLASDYKEVRYSSDIMAEYLEFDPETLFQASMDLLSATIARAGIPYKETVILALTGQRHGCVFLDEKMQPVLAVANLDGRVDQETLRRFEIHRDTIYKITGRLPSEIFPALRLVWLAANQSDVFRRIHGFLMINEWFSFRLTGKPYAEKTSISESLLFDVRDASWSEQLLELFRQKDLATWPVVDPGTIVGTIQSECAGRYSLPQGALISLSAGDTQCAVIGSRAFETGDVVAVNGSTTPIVMVTDELVFDPLQRTWADLFIDDRYLIESNAGKTGMVYRGLTKALSCQELPEASPEMVFEARRLNISATLVPDPAEPIDFLGSPYEIRFTADPVQVLRLLPYLMMENTAFAIVANIDEVTRVMKMGPRRVYLTGGSSRSPLTQTIVSVLLKASPLILTSTYDTTSKGAAMLALSRVQSRLSVRDVFSSGDADNGETLYPGSVQGSFVELVRERYQQWRERFTGMKRNG